MVGVVVWVRCGNNSCYFLLVQAVFFRFWFLGQSIALG